MTAEPSSQAAGSIAELFDNAPCGFVALGANGVIVQVNETFAAMTGHRRDWLLGGRKFTELLTIPVRIYHETHINPLLQMQGFVKEIALDVIRQDDRRLHVLLNAVNRPASSGGPSLTLMTIFDATDRRQYEHEILLARRQAELAVDAERTAKEAAEAAGRVKDDFLAMVSHELRTPLNAILGWTQILQNEPDTTQEQREALDIIERNARVQSELIGDLLDMSRIMAGKMRLNVQEINLHEVIEASIGTVKPSADARSVRIQKVIDPTVIVSATPAGCSRCSGTC